MDLHVLLQTEPAGPYSNWYKVLVVLLVSLVWWRLLTWIDKDAPAARLPREWVNLGMVGSYALGFFLFLLAPAGFGIALTLFVFIMLASFGAYIVIRHKKVGLEDLVAELKNMKLPGGAGRKKVVDEVVGAVVLATKDGRPMHQPEPETPERPSYDVLQVMLAEPIRRGMERLELAPQEASMLTQYWVDGVMYPGAQFNKTASTGAINILKQLAGLDVAEKRKPQTGMMQATVDGKRHEVRVQTAGSTAGESLRLMIDPRHRHDLALAEVGMSAEQIQQVDALVGEPGGVVLIAVPKGQGLTSVAYAMIRKHDAFLTHIHSVERDPEDELEGITQNKLAKGASPNDELQQVQWVISQEPDVILMPDLTNPKSARELIAFASHEKRVYIGMRSGSATDAIAEWRQMVGDDDLAMRHLRMVVCGRLVRKLCPACKQPYQPDAETLRKLNLDHGRAQQFFQARTQPMVDQKGNPITCSFCAEMRYHGRTGVFEVMSVNDEVRHAVTANSTANQIRALFRKMHGRFIQEQALDLVEKGETSIQEVLRAMRGQEQDPRGAAAHPSGTGAPAGGSGTFSSSGTSAAQGTRPGRPASPGR